MSSRHDPVPQILHEQESGWLSSVDGPKLVEELLRIHRDFPEEDIPHLIHNEISSRATLLLPRTALLESYLARFPDHKETVRNTVDLIYCQQEVLPEIERLSDSASPSHNGQLPLTKKQLPLDHLSPPGFTILGELGRGGMGVVYEALEDSLGRVVALKMVEETEVSDDASKRFEQEARTMADLQHPNIVQIYSSGRHENTPFLCMELIKGGTLAARLREEKNTTMSPIEAAELIKTLA